MKPKSTLFIFLAGLFLIACQEDQKETETGKTIGSLYISDATPSPGDSLQITYEPKTETTQEDLWGFYHYVVGDEIYSHDLKLRDSSGLWKAKVAIPDSAMVVAFNFKVNEAFDTNDKKGYVLPLYNEEGETVPGAKAGKVYFFKRVGNWFGVEMELEEDSILAIVRKDFEKHPELNEIWEIDYARMLAQSDASKAEAYIDQRMAFYSKKETLSEEDFNTIVRFHQMLGHKEKADSLRQVAAEKYPKGVAAERAYFMKFRQAKSLGQQAEMWETYNTKFNDDPRFKNAMARMMANQYLAKKNFEKFTTLTNKIPDKTTKASLYNSAAWNMAEKGENLEQAAKISKNSLELMQAAMKTPEEKHNSRTKRQYLNSLERSYRMYADTYAYILFKQGKPQEALAYQEKAVGKGYDSDINERYIQYLLTTDNAEKARKKAAEFIKNNQANATTKEYFKEAYVKTKGSEKGFEEKLAALEKTAHQKALAEIKKEMMHEPAPKFTMKDLKGNEISLASLKGKTVILDFWATWCGPCRASFPGMQKAVEKYKDNPKVAFFFVNTMETAKTPEARNKKVGGFIERNEYDFHVLLDQPVKEGARNFITAGDYNVSGIPTKIIIGPEGNINFKKVGYGGNNEKMLQEIKMMIELAQKQGASSKVSS